MKRGKKLIFLLAVLIVLTGVTSICLRLNPDDLDDEEEEGTVILSIDSGDVTEISWTIEGEQLEFMRSEDGWTYTKDSEFPVNTAALELVLSALNEITSSKTIEAVTDMSEYGLDAPAYIITVDETETYEILIGNETSMGGEYYLSIGDGNVYLVDSSVPESFSSDLYTLVQKETLPDMTEIQQFTIEGADCQMALVYTPNDDDDDEVWFLKQENEYTAVDTSLTENFMSYITGLVWSDCVNYHADETALAAYGLDEPSLRVTVIYGENEEAFVLEIGNTEDTYSYARISGSDMVYLIDASIGEAMESLTLEELQLDTDEE